MGAIPTINHRRTGRSDRSTNPASTGRRVPGISRFLAVVALAGLSVPAVVGLGAPAATAAASGSLTATFQKTSDWGSGYVANYNIVDGGAPTSSWTLTFRHELHPDQRGLERNTGHRRNGHRRVSGDL